jgi:hypothetical protein
VENDSLSVHVQDQELRMVLQDIAAKGQIEVRHLEGLPSRRISVRFAELPMVDGLKRLFRAADVPGYALVTSKQGDKEKVERVVLLAAEEGPGGAGQGMRGPQRSASATSPRQPPVPAAAPRPPQPQAERDEDRESGDRAGSSTSVFEDLRTNAAAKRLLSQMMHPNEQVRERALEGLIRLMPEDEKQRDLLEFLEPLMEDLSSEDKATQDEAREELRKLLNR